VILRLLTRDAANGRPGVGERPREDELPAADRQSEPPVLGEVLTGDDPADADGAVDSHAEHRMRPAWTEGMTQVADASDVLTGYHYRVWHTDARVSGGRWRRRTSNASYVVEAGGAALATLDSWSDVTSWLDRNVIAAGWRVLDDRLAR
jgi:hypothetical protein